MLTYDIAYQPPEMASNMTGIGHMLRPLPTMEDVEEVTRPEPTLVVLLRRHLNWSTLPVSFLLPIISKPVYFVILIVFLLMAHIFF